jgi:hypothetical protein
LDNFKTTEVRWFARGALPDELFTWFEELGEPLAKADNRTDVYLQSSSPDLGVKLRQGNLEVKYRQAKLGTIDIDGKISQVEQWSKWICIDDAARFTPENIADRSGWIKVGKVRYQRLYQVKFTDPIELTSIAQPTDGAAAIEITQLQLNNHSWWTIACEYLGDKIDLECQFCPLVKLLLLGSPLPINNSSISCGYPEWLNSHKVDISVFTD